MPPAIIAGAMFLGASAATAATIASVTVAIAAAALKGAIVGAIVGGGMAAITGGNILKGALKGAAIGAVTGGALKGFQIATAPAVAAPTAVAPTAVAPTAAAPTAVPQVTGDVAVNMPTQAASVESLQAASQAADTAAATAATSKAQIYAGIGEGLASGTVAAGAGMIESREAEDLERLKFAEEQRRIAGNIPGQFKAEVANIEIANWWDRHLAEQPLPVGATMPAQPINQGLLTPRPGEVTV